MGPSAHRGRRLGRRDQVDDRSEAPWMCDGKSIFALITAASSATWMRDDDEHGVGAGLAVAGEGDWRRKRAYNPPSRTSDERNVTSLHLFRQDGMCARTASASRRLRGDGSRAPCPCGEGARPSRARSRGRSARGAAGGTARGPSCRSVRLSSSVSARHGSADQSSFSATAAASLTSSRSSWLSSGGSISPWSTANQPAKSRQPLEVRPEQQPILFGRAARAGGPRLRHKSA